MFQQELNETHECGRCKEARFRSEWGFEVTDSKTSSLDSCYVTKSYILCPNCGYRELIFSCTEYGQILFVAPKKNKRASDKWRAHRSAQASTADKIVGDGGLAGNPKTTK